MGFSPVTVHPMACTCLSVAVLLYVLDRFSLIKMAYSEEFKDIYMEHSPSLTESTWLMCNTCQKACPIGHDLRFEKRERVNSPE
jgi:hypothetical protein